MISKEWTLEASRKFPAVQWKRPRPEYISVPGEGQNNLQYSVSATVLLQMFVAALS